MPIDEVLGDINVKDIEMDPEEKLTQYYKQKIKLNDKIKKLTKLRDNIDANIEKLDVEVNPHSRDTKLSLRVKGSYSEKIFLGDYIINNFSSPSEIYSKTRKITTEVYKTKNNQDSNKFFNEIKVVFYWKDKITRNRAGYLCNNCDGLVQYRQGEIGHPDSCKDCGGEVHTEILKPLVNFGGPF
jgi:hypothetical protein